MHSALLGVGSLRKTTTTVPEEVGDSFQQNRNLLRTLSALKEEHERELAHLERLYNEKLKRNKKQKEDFEKSMKQENDRILKLQEEVDSLSSRDRLETEDLDYKKKNKELEVTIEALEEERDAKEREIIELTGQLTKSKQKLKEMKETVKALPHYSSIENMQREKRQLELDRDQNMAKLKTEKQGYDEHISKLETTLAEKLKEAEELQQENSNLSQEMDELEAAVSKMRAECLAMKRQIDQNGAMIPLDQVRHRMAQAEERKREAVNKQRALMEASLQKAQKQQMMLDKELKQRYTSIEEMNQKLSDITQEETDAKMQFDKEATRMRKEHQKLIRQLRNDNSAKLQKVLEEHWNQMLSAAESGRSFK